MNDKTLDLLLSEYMQLQKTIEEFDAKALTIKAWSVTLSAAGIVASYAEGHAFILLIAAFSALAFWLVEAQWKENQQAFYPRIYAIERALAADGGIAVSPLQIASSWSEAWHAGRRNRLMLSIVTWPHVWLPHAPVAVGGILLFLLAPP